MYYTKFFVDLGDFDRINRSEEIYIRTSDNGELYDICNMEVCELEDPKKAAEQIVKRVKDYDKMLDALKEARKLLQKKGITYADVYYVIDNAIKSAD